MAKKRPYPKPAYRKTGPAKPVKKEKKKLYSRGTDKSKKYAKSASPYAGMSKQEAADAAIRKHKKKKK